MTKFCPKCNKEFHASVFIEHLKSHHSDETIMLCILQELMEIHHSDETIMLYILQELMKINERGF